MKYPHILARITATPWAILPSAFEAINQALYGLRDFAIELPTAEDGEDVAPQPTLVGATAIIPISGIIGKHLSLMETVCGGCDLDSVEASFEEAMTDPAVADVILKIDSPGGTVPGVPELAHRMRARSAATGKRVYSYTDTLMASAGYWLATAADYLAASPTATVGSIGVYAAFEDCSEMYAKDGRKIILVKSGKFKDMGSPHRPMTEEELGMLQARTDALWAMFKADVETARPAIAPDAMEGQVFLGSQAASVGLIDELVPDFTAFLAAVQSLRSTPPAG